MQLLQKGGAVDGVDRPAECKQQ